METANEKYEREIREYDGSQQKYRDLGRHADVAIQMYMDDPSKFDAEFIMVSLVSKHMEIGFDKI